MTPSDGQKWTQIAPAAILNEKKKGQTVLCPFFFEFDLAAGAMWPPQMVKNGPKSLLRLS